MASSLPNYKKFVPVSKRQMPSKKVLEYGLWIRKNYPKVWFAGGNQRGLTTA